MDIKKRKIAVLSPVAWRTPPRQYGAWETVAGNITEGLVKRGWDVTLFATKDSLTSAKLHAVIEKGYEEDKQIDPKVAEYLHISELIEHSHKFDLIHNNYDFMPLTYSRLIRTPMLTTIHGFSSDKIRKVYYKYKNDGYFVSISDADRDRNLPYLATVYNGIDISQITFRRTGGDKLVFLGRIHPDKGTHLAIEVARKTGLDLIIAGIIQDEEYFRQKIKPHINAPSVTYIGAVNPEQRNELFAKAYALLHLNTIPERFGLVIAEAMAAGVPVIASDNGSCREVLENGKTGYLAKNTNQAADAVKKIEKINREDCRKRVEQNFTIEKMASNYEKVYEQIFQQEENKKQK